MSEISPRTAELALIALRRVIEQAQARRNGTLLPADVLAAFVELGTAHTNGSPTRTGIAAEPADVQRFPQIDVAEAAQRLGITRRAVQKRCAAGSLPAVRVGRRAWLIEWKEPSG